MVRLDLQRPVVVTGGAGAIGSVLVQELLAQGAAVRVLDNFSSGRSDHLPGGGHAPHLTVHRVDIRHLPEVARAVRGAGSVFHLAANPDIRLGTEEPSLDLEHGTVGTFHVLEAARKAEVPFVAFSSSSVVYGLPDKFPTPEEYGPLIPQSLYGASKLASEALLGAYAHTYGLSTTIYRFANIIGPTMTHGVIFDFFEKLRKDPGTARGPGRRSSVQELAQDGGLRPRDARGRPEGHGARGRLQPRHRGSGVGQGDRRKGRGVPGGPRPHRVHGGSRGWAGDIPVQLLDTTRIRGLGWAPRWNSHQAVDQTITELAARSA